jgi:hypothetical protein
MAARTAITSRDPLMSLRVIASLQPRAEAVFVVDATQAGSRDALRDAATSIRFKARRRGSRWGRTGSRAFEPSVPWRINCWTSIGYMDRVCS